MAIEIKIFNKPKQFWQKITRPVAKSKRELLADTAFTVVGVVVAILAIKSGGWLGFAGWSIMIMLILLLFLPEN